MTRRRKKSGNSGRVSLTPQELAVAATHMMSAAQAHQQASIWCIEKPIPEPPGVETFYFQLVSFELLLLSIEQSLRLLILLNFSINRTIHNVHRLYKILQNRAGRDMRIRKDLLRRANAISEVAAKTRNENFLSFTENDLVSLLNMHDSSYSTFRYFQLDEGGRLIRTKWQLSPRDFNIMNFFALALISFNQDEMAQRQIALPSIRENSKDEMPEYVKGFMDRVTAEREATENGE